MRYMDPFGLLAKDISSCAYVNRLSLHQMRSQLGSLQLDFALIIQGDSDAELPERFLDLSSWLLFDGWKSRKWHMLVCSAE